MLILAYAWTNVAQNRSELGYLLARCPEAHLDDGADTLPVAKLRGAKIQ